MWKNVEHIGIAVKDLSGVNEIYTKLFGESPYKMESVETEQVDTSFFKVGETKIEFLSATDPDSAIAKFIEKRGEGIHHIAFEVEDIHHELERFRKRAFSLHVLKYLKVPITNWYVSSIPNPQMVSWWNYVKR